jgi:uncharacterized repeat protein (TIGR02543 family)
MNKHVASMSFSKRFVRFTALALVVILATLAHLVAVPNSAKASTTVDVNGVELDFSSSKRTATNNNTTVGGTATYTNVATIGGIQIDAVVTTVGLSNATISSGGYDNPGSASANEKYFQIDNTATVAGGFTSFKFEFFDHADGSIAVLKNVKVTSIDLDSPGRQFTEFSGFQSYVFASSTHLSAYTTNQAGTALANGLVRFTQTRTNTAVTGSNVAADAVEVDFDQLSSYVAVFGNEQAQGGYFGISFKALCSTVTPCTAGASVGNPNNNPPTSVSSTRYYDLSVPATLFLDNFPYTDIDGNAFRSLKITTLPSTGTLEYFNGSSWVSATVGTVITTADIQLGYLRYTGTGSSFGYKVNDGLVDSTAAYTLTLVGAANGQVITFANPGNKAPTAANFASNATANSGLTVVLTSLTPSICAVVGLNIDPLAVGACTIVASQPGNSSYGAAANVTQTFYITTDAAQIITLANPGDKTWTGSSFTIPTTPTATSGLAVTLTSFSPSVCTISGTTITIVGQGTCQIRATQGGGVSGGTTYAAAPPVTISFVVASAPAPSTYNITYNSNTSTGGSAPTTQNGSGTVTLASNSGTLVKTGYTFTGWNTLANGSGTHYNASGSYNLTADVTLYAEWTIVNYTLTYDGNSSDGGTVPTAQTGSGNVTVAANLGLLTQSGYTFTGWNTLANGSGTHYNIGSTYNLTADVTLYAEWATSTYTVFYDGNGNSGGSVPSSQTGNGNVTLATNSGTLALTGYTFTGWNTLANGSGTHYATGATYNLNADVTLYAEWTAAPATFTITYDGNGKTGGATPSDTVGNGNVTLATNSGTLTKTGYTFGGWNTLANGSGTHYATGATYSLTADVTLYAEWTANNYTITYRGNGNTGGAVGPDTVGIDGSTVTIDNNTGSLVKTGYRFNGWNTAANGNGTNYEEGTSTQITGNLTLYAVWVALSFTITFDGNTSTGGSVPTSVTGYGTKTITSAAGTLVKTGYIFKGWNTQADGQGTRLGTSYNLIADVTLYAEWQLIPAIIYSPNGATGGTTPNDIPNGTPITIDPNTGNLIRAGYRFLGWNTQPNGGGTHYGAGMTPVLPEGTVLYAEWAKVSSLASTGSNYGEEISGATALFGLGLFLNAIASIRRRRVRKN